MRRNLTPQQMAQMVVTKSMTPENMTYHPTNPITREPLDYPVVEIASLFEYFEGRPIYSMPLPALTIPHPEYRRSLVDPVLAEVPKNMTIDAETYRFLDFYQLTEYINTLVEENFEVFIYTIRLSPTIYDPYTFNPRNGLLVRLKIIDRNLWYDSTAVSRPKPPIPPRVQEEPQLVRRTLEINNIVIKKSLGRLRFK